MLNVFNAKNPSCLFINLLKMVISPISYIMYSKLHNILGFKPSNFSYSNLKNWRKQDDSKVTPVYYNFTINGFEQKIRLQEDRLTSLLSNMNSDVRLELATKMIYTIRSLLPIRTGLINVSTHIF